MSFSSETQKQMIIWESYILGLDQGFDVYLMTMTYSILQQACDSWIWRHWQSVNSSKVLNRCSWFHHRTTRRTQFFPADAIQYAVLIIVSKNIQRHTSDHRTQLPQPIICITLTQIFFYPFLKYQTDRAAPFWNTKYKSSQLCDGNICKGHWHSLLHAIEQIITMVRQVWHNSETLRFVERKMARALKVLSLGLYQFTGLGQT